MILSRKQALYAARLKTVRSRIAQACVSSGVQASEVALLAVSKRHPIEAIKGLHALGLRDFGENYATEGIEKRHLLEDIDAAWHFIGPIQSNKTRPIAENFDWVHSVDRIRIAQRLSRQRPETMEPLQVLLQVNIDSEPQKAGLEPEKLSELAEQVAVLPALQLRGLMALPRFGKSEAEQRASFHNMKLMFEKLKAVHKQVDTLSMGMSDDLEIAIQEGSTMIRVGTALFGPREDS